MKILKKGTNMENWQFHEGIKIKSLSILLLSK